MFAITGSKAVVMTEPNQNNNGTTRAYDVSALVVLPVEPNDNMRALVRSILGSFGIERITESRTGAEALDHLATRTVDVVITGLVMAPMNGDELIRRIRQAEGPEKFLPVITLSGHSDMAHVAAARDAGATDFLAKPVRPRDVYAHLVRVIEDRRPFVRTHSYFGPDRRRGGATKFDGPDRREPAATEAATEAAPEAAPEAAKEAASEPETT